jgi:hypothetical protein
VQPRPVHHEAVHRDPRPVVLQVRHCNAIGRNSVTNTSS